MTMPTTRRRRRTWRGEIIVPVAALVLCALVAGALTWGEPIRQALRERWQPGSWALTTGDLPPGAAQIPVDPGWVVPYPPHEPAPHLLPGLRYLESHFLTRGWSPHDEEVEVATAVSGVQHGAVSVYTSVFTPDPRDPAPHPIGKIYAGSIRDKHWPDQLIDHAADAGVELTSLRRIGEHTRGAGGWIAPGWQDYTERDTAAGHQGYTGFTAVETDPATGAQQRVTVVMTAVSGTVALVATLAPVDAEVPEELEVDALVARVAEKVVANPPESS
ncbi:hypothetical protein [Isoptericola croceus]|uniref:hypothetical protein n=1 Tax=Isoptericola croceus TaxID=3031406 RepID=UPI0023F7942D|nr:hypothetical protein [Isoptericola croceus]